MEGQEQAATTLVAVGTAAALPSATTGAADWSALSREQRRVGLVHAAANLVAVGLYGASLAARLRGNHRAGRRLGYVGLSVAGAGAYLGGHLSFAQAAGVNQAAAGRRLIPEGWGQVGDVEGFVDGQPAVRHLGDTPVLGFRRGERFTVLLERCAHDSGPLGEGVAVQTDGQWSVACPWCGSTYRLSDGAVLHGPAATDQPTLLTRIVAGRLEAAPA